MAEKPRFRLGTVFAKNLDFGVGFGYRNNTTQWWCCFADSRAGIPLCLAVLVCWTGRLFAIVGQGVYLP